MSKSKKKNNRANKPEKKRIITQKRVNIAILVVIAVAIITSLFVKYAVPRIKDAVSHNEGAQLDNNYEFVKYGKGEIPSDFAKILKSAEADEAAACKEYGTVLTIGDRKISYSTLLMYYVDKYNSHLVDASEDEKKFGYSTENFAYNMYPEFINRSKDQNWAEYITDEIVEDIAWDYFLFDKALEENFKPSDSEIEEIQELFISTRNLIMTSGESVEEILERNYTKGATLDIYCAKQIIIGYAECYLSHLKEDVAKDLNDKDLQDELNNNEKNYQVFCGRIYPISGDNTDAVGIENEEDYLAFVASDIGDNDKNNADKATEARFATYNIVSNAYGNTVADYIFSPDRKSGEISTVDNGKYTFLVYVDRPAYFENSVSCVLYYQFYTGSDEETKNKDINDMKDYYQEWEKEGAAKDQLIRHCIAHPANYSMLPFGETNMRVNSFYADVDAWLRKPERKEGDHELFIFENMIAIVYFEKNNTEDFDWMQEISENIAQSIIEEKFSDEKNNNYPVTIAEDKLQNIYTDAHKPIENLVSIAVNN